MPIQYGRSRGFTLIEMSIVLVIIGLIIGGILKGQEVIANARQKSVINQINAVRAAAGTYFDRYRTLPGDDPVATSQLNAAVANGNGNGVVGANNADVDAVLAEDGSIGEPYAFFNGLMAANLLNGGQVATVGASGVANFGTSALPSSPISGAGLTVAYGTLAGDGTGNDRTAHWVRVHKDSVAPAAVATARAVSPRMAHNIDVQTDDGQAGRGGARGDGSTTCLTGASGSYALSDNALCVPLYEITQ